MAQPLVTSLIHKQIRLEASQRSRSNTQEIEIQKTIQVAMLLS
jgi:hypothetical protein